jgi:hypothetical protein
MKLNTVEPDFTDDEYNKLMNHFRKNELNQFYMLILKKVLTKKKFTALSNEVLTETTAILADRVGKTSTKITTDEQIITFIIEIYNLLLIIDIIEFNMSRF